MLPFAKALRRIMGDYLGIVVLSERLAGHANSLSLLASVARNSATLVDQLSRLDQQYLLALEEFRAEPFDGVPPPRFDILSLTHKLTRLGHAADRVKASLKPNSRGAPAKQLLDRTVAQLLVEVEQRGFDVTLSESGSRTVRRRRVEGRGGELLLAIFQRFNLHVNEPQIWGSLDRVRKQQSQIRTRPLGKDESNLMASPTRNRTTAGRM